jgi:hypothetical protein
MSKKILLVILFLILFLMVGFLVYKYVSQHSEEEVNGADQGNGSTGLFICADKCGDGVCQTSDPNCGESDSNLNCICPETQQECPQDCQ